ncbi:MAG: NADH:ubiquinone reductase (Na(+)-transporting) subunit D [Spirochaetia bacterium]|jgi:Na+-transporting NADH:ubiquinone oxidoreductase subunit D|nr:NADH:ubiquinone reductase (Na(+)-transporting) subunit D [Spirochaetia bacterium]MCE1210211.1 NADH:ubiquinone reductase (Na(+)-transporting) subunit D [Spirochaetia bacterium]MDD3821129.1 NADH:ubiquinone reductase (Na(+)-transporting) subunit D [Spirochaetales bacterium]
MSPARKVLREGLWSNNPIFVQVLGICSTLAVTNNLSNTLVMVLGVTFATAMGSWTLSLLKDLIPRKVRMIVQVLVLSFYVIIVDILLKAYQPAISKQLGPYVGLIITNCILMGRAEAFAAANKPGLSFLDGVANGLGYGWVLISIAFVRELLGFGTFFGLKVFGEGFTPWTIMVMAPSAFFLVALALWAANILKAKAEAAAKAPKPKAPGAASPAPAKQ